VSRLTVHPVGPLRLQTRVPGDKSISHRALLLSALADGISLISGFLPGGDCLATLGCLRGLGVNIEMHGPTQLTVHGRGLHGLQAPSAPLDCARSGTTMRLLAGMLAGQAFGSKLVGDAQLLRRPMRRVVEPLRHMGAEITDTNGRAPLTIQGQRLQGCQHRLSIASAQVKSALLLAGLYADGPTAVEQPGSARDHTERMLATMGAAIEVSGLTVTLYPSPSLRPLCLDVPGDLSSAAFPLVAAALLPDSMITIGHVGVNPTRTGLLDALQAMGADIQVANQQEVSNEPVADVAVRGSALAGVEIHGDMVVRMIDELPVFAVAATQAQGTTVVRDAAELRVKESDRIASLVSELRLLGAHIEPLTDGFVVQGPTPLHAACVDSHGDHRLAMAWAVAGLVADGLVEIQRAECIADSFPGFVELLESVGATGD